MSLNNFADPSFSTYPNEYFRIFTDKQGRRIPLPSQGPEDRRGEVSYKNPTLFLITTQYDNGTKMKTVNFTPKLKSSVVTVMKVDPRSINQFIDVGPLNDRVPDKITTDLTIHRPISFSYFLSEIFYHNFRKLSLVILVWPCVTKKLEEGI